MPVILQLDILTPFYEITLLGDFLLLNQSNALKIT